jgi:hypothetical protein
MADWYFQNKFTILTNCSNIQFPLWFILDLSKYFSFFLNRPLLPCGVEGFLLVSLLDNW